MITLRLAAVFFRSTPRHPASFEVNPFVSNPLARRFTRAGEQPASSSALFAVHRRAHGGCAPRGGGLHEPGNSRPHHQRCLLCIVERMVVAPREVVLIVRTSQDAPDIKKEEVGQL